MSPHIFKDRNYKHTIISEKCFSIKSILVCSLKYDCFLIKPQNGQNVFTLNKDYFFPPTR